MKKRLIVVRQVASQMSPEEIEIMNRIKESDDNIVFVSAGTPVYVFDSVRDFVGDSYE